MMSVQRGRKRHLSDRSDDEYDADYPDQDYRMEPEEESKTVMLRGLSLHVVEEDVSLCSRIKQASLHVRAPWRHEDH